MKIITNLKNYESPFKTVVTVGTFDGIHQGHRKLIEKVVNRSRAKHAKSLLLTFKNHPLSVIKYKKVKRIMEPEDRILNLKKLGINYLAEIVFEKRIRELSPETFVREILIRRLKMTELVAGQDFRFGKEKKGDISILKKWSRKYGYKVTIVKPVKIDGEKVSSTKIRSYIENGSIKKVNRMLGYKYNVTVNIKRKVFPGLSIGRFTEDIKIKNYLCLPKGFFYGSLIFLDSKGMRKFVSRYNPDSILNNKMELYICGNRDKKNIKEVKLFFEKEI